MIPTSTEPKASAAETDTVRFSYREVGHGPVVLCLHGTGPGATGWANYAEVAGALSRDFRIVVPDLPGFGDSEILADDDRAWAAMSAAELALFLRSIGIQRAHVIGNSAGGSVAVHLATIAPELVDSLTLMGCAGLRVPMFSPRELEGVRLLRSYRPNPSLEKMRAIVNAFLYDPSAFDVEAIARERYADSMEEHQLAGPSRIARDRPRSLELTPEQLSRVDLPTLLLWGREDRFVGVDDALAFLAFLPDARLVLLPKCGHWVQHERRSDFVTQVRGFVNQVEAEATNVG